MINFNFIGLDLIINNSSRGINISDAGGDTEIRNNTIYGHGEHGLYNWGLD